MRRRRPKLSTSKKIFRSLRETLAAIIGWLWRTLLALLNFIVVNIRWIIGIALLVWALLILTIVGAALSLSLIDGTRWDELVFAQIHKQVKIELVTIDE